MSGGKQAKRPFAQWYAQQCSVDSPALTEQPGRPPEDHLPKQSNAQSKKQAKAAKGKKGKKEKEVVVFLDGPSTAPGPYRGPQGYTMGNIECKLREDISQAISDTFGQSVRPSHSTLTVRLYSVSERPNSPRSH